VHVAVCEDAVCCSLFQSVPVCCNRVVSLETHSQSAQDTSARLPYMYIHMYTHTYIHIYIPIHTHKCAYTHAGILSTKQQRAHAIYVYTYVYVRIHTYVCIRTYTYVRIHTYSCHIGIYICIYIYSHIYIYIYHTYLRIYIHTHIYIPIRIHICTHAYSAHNSSALTSYGVDTISRLLKITGLFCRISSLL